MDRARRHMPVGNRITYQKHVAQCKRLHRKKLKSIKANVDNKPPRSHKMYHMKRNLKKEQLMEERFSIIEKDNRLLLEKMSHIMQHKTLDNHSSSMRYKHSLNMEFRRNSLSKITRENQNILKRIQTSNPTYDHRHWENEYSKNIQYMGNISEYEYKPPLSRPRTSSGLNCTTSRPSSRSSTRSRPRTRSGMKSSLNSNSTPAGRYSGTSEWGTGSAAPRPSTSHGMGKKMQGEFSADLGPIRVSRKRDGANVLIYNEARTLTGVKDLGPLRISVWDNGTATDLREDATSGIRILAEEPKSNGQRFELTLTVQQLKHLVADSAVLSSILSDGVIPLDPYERLHTRVHAALMMQYDSRLSMQLGIHLLSRVMVDSNTNKMILIDDISEKPMVFKETPAPDTGGEFWEELEIAKELKKISPEENIEAIAETKNEEVLDEKPVSGKEGIVKYDTGGSASFASSVEVELLTNEDIKIADDKIVPEEKSDGVIVSEVDSTNNTDGSIIIASAEATKEETTEKSEECLDASATSTTTESNSFDVTVIEHQIKVTENPTEAEV